MLLTNYVVLEAAGEDQLDRSCKKAEILKRVKESGYILH